jgi:hypothetical protein
MELYQKIFLIRNNSNSRLRFTTIIQNYLKQKEVFSSREYERITITDDMWVVWDEIASFDRHVTLFIGFDTKIHEKSPMIWSSEVHDHGVALKWMMSERSCQLGLSLDVAGSFFFED